MNEIELDQRLGAIEVQLVKVQKIETALRERPAAVGSSDRGKPVILPALPSVAGAVDAAPSAAAEGARPVPMGGAKGGAAMT